MKADPPTISVWLSIAGITIATISFGLAAYHGIEWALLPFTVILGANVVMGLANSWRWRYRPGREPTPPTNVRIRTRWGVEIPVQCVYVGCFDGIHRWEVIRPHGVNTPFDVAEMKVERLPGRTAIALFEEPKP
jgi:hypothetical protein